MTDASAFEVEIAAGEARLEGSLVLPAGTEGIVMFAHGSGSSRHSPRNQYVARRLNEAGLGTLLFDLLTAREEQRDLVSHALRFDIPLLAGRVADAARWLAARPEAAGMRIGVFGASTGAAAALVAAAREPDIIAAVVSRGGRPDLANDALSLVRAPTLLIVGSHDHACIPLNEMALARLKTPHKRLVIVEGAGHLFEEPGTLDEVADLAADWFVTWLARPD